MNKNKWERPLCNLCGSDDEAILYDRVTYWEYEGVFRVVQCRKCKLVYTSPRPVRSQIGKYYDQKYYWGRDFSSPTQTFDEGKEREKAYGNVYKIILSAKKKGTILDIGAGSGQFLSKFKDLGWKVDGVDLSKKACAYAKKQYKITLRCGDLLDFSLKKNSYDVITLNGALEHLYNPQETLFKTYNVLKKGGVLVFSVPNVNSLGRKMYGKNWFPWQLPRHLYHFSPHTVMAMLRNAGFRNTTIKHDYALQNYYILFQSLRFSKSPKFAKKPDGNFRNNSQIPRISFKKEIGKIVGRVIASLGVLIEPIIQRGEVIIAISKK